ncbi:hypothetical protein ELUMI_v1c05050 [Williamsoniiplasma luminosum]|uniref:Uncharacterized protein n=1 Tax=Williamsoniiplasma luminosum TaxID=214888 RepID=A0A2K8NTV9_9MOLU|nr:hypothetical protein [Williamsoniiplasma luminosum]ATZ17229.1 hypothetical protein ELUMI_v1c05050 [Williamsoniiplasma luminosum]
MNKKKWNYFYDEVNKLEIVSKIKEWCKSNNVLFEPYARVGSYYGDDDNSMACSCCFKGEIDTRSKEPNYEYVFLAIGDNAGSWKVDNSEERDPDVIIKEYERNLTHEKYAIPVWFQFKNEERTNDFLNYMNWTKTDEVNPLYLTNGLTFEQSRKLTFTDEAEMEVE